MKSKLLLLAFLFAFLSSATFPQLSGDYHIPQGTNPQGFASLGAACTAINTGGVSAPVRFIIDTSLSETASALSINTSALAAGLQISKSNSLTILPNTGKNDTITIGGTGATGILVTSTNYIIFDGSNGSGSGLTFLFNVTSASNGFNILGSSNIKIQNCNVLFQIPASYAAIEAQFNGTVLSDSITIQNIVLNSVTGVAPSKYGIYTKGISGTNFSSAQIKNNTIYALNVALDMNYFTASGATSEISGNTIYLGTTLATSYVEAIYFADYGGTVNVFNNKVLQIAAAGTASVMYGIATNYLALPSTTLNIYNNFITGFSCAAAYAGPLYGIYLGEPTGAVRPTVNMYYNTILVNSPGSAASGTVGAVGRLTTTNPQTITMKDNILINNNGTATSYAVYIPGITATLISDYNDLYVTGSGNVGYYNTAATATLAAWTTASGGDLHSVSKLVNFVSSVSPFDLHLAGASIGDAGLTGQAVAGITSDINGNTRSTIYPYEGADENAALLYPIPINGDLSDPQYITLATKLNSNSGFGSAMDVSKLVYYPDTAHGVLYVGIQGKLDNASNNAIGLMMGFSQLAGLAAGTALGGTTNGGGYMGTTGNNNYTADFPVSYMLSINPGNSTNCYVDGVKLLGSRAASYLGNCTQAASAVTGPGGASDFFAQNSVSFAFDNSGTSNKGFEMRIPFSQLGITKASAFQMFAFIVSSSSYFSDVTVPGNITTGNLANNPDFNALTATEGPFHTTPVSLPVELSSFTANINGNSVVLNWKTATELNSNVFEVERSSVSSPWVSIGSIQGAGNSNSVKNYSFTDSKLPMAGKYSYRLKQVDFNGSFKYSNVAEVNYTSPAKFALSQNYPNPFNPSTIIEYALPQASNVKLTVYNAIGQTVRLLENGYKEAGNYTISFNASTLPSGIYFYKLEAGQNSQIRKMMLVK
jgi:hypothetical protein